MYKKDNTEISTLKAYELSKKLGVHIESLGYEYVSGDVLLQTYTGVFFIVKDGKFLGNKVKLWENGIIFETVKGLKKFFGEKLSNNQKIHIRWGSTALEAGASGRKPKK